MVGEWMNWTSQGRAKLKAKHGRVLMQKPEGLIMIPFEYNTIVHSALPLRNSKAQRKYANIDRLSLSRDFNVGAAKYVSLKTVSNNYIRAAKKTWTLK